MIREAGINDGRDDEKKFREILEPYEQEILKFMNDELVYELASIQLASGYKHGAIWSDSSMKKEFEESVDFLNIAKPKFENIDKKRIKKILKEKYGLLLTCEDPIRIEKIQ